MDFLKNVSVEYKLDNDELEDIYKYHGIVKSSGYMLYVKEYYKIAKESENKKKFIDNTKIISETWKNMTMREKEKYNKEARAINTKNKKITEEEKKKEDKDKQENYIDDYNDILGNITLMEHIHEGKTYFKDCFDNIINENGEYVVL